MNRKQFAYHVGFSIRVIAECVLTYNIAVHTGSWALFLALMWIFWRLDFPAKKDIEK